MCQNLPKYVDLIIERQISDVCGEAKPQDPHTGRALLRLRPTMSTISALKLQSFLAFEGQTEVANLPHLFVFTTSTNHRARQQIKNIYPRSGFYRATAMLSAVYAVVVCVCVSVCLSVTLRYCIKTAKRRIMQITPHDSPVTLFF